MTLEQRFKEAAATLVAQAQDLDVLTRQHLLLQKAFQEQQQQMAALRGKLLDGQSLVVGLNAVAVGAADDCEPLRDRARKWLAEIGEV